MIHFHQYGSYSASIITQSERNGNEKYNNFLESLTDRNLSNFDIYLRRFFLYNRKNRKGGAS